MVKKKGRRRRGKKDVILDFRKKPKPSDPTANRPTKTISKRKYETTGQYLRRLDRLAAKAKLEAAMDDKFDTNYANTVA